MTDITQLDPGYMPIFEAFETWGQAHGSIQAMYVSGSLAKGDADVFSDLDLVVITPIEDIDVLVEKALDVISEIEPVVLENQLKPIPGICVLSTITDQWHRVDVAFGSAESGILYQQLVPVFDPDGLYKGAPPETEPSPASADEVVSLVTEFLRVLGLSVVVNGRGDAHVAHDGANLLRNMLIELFLMEPPRSLRPGAKKLLPVLSEEQQAILRDLPPLADNFELLNAFNQTIAAVFIARARVLVSSVEAEWPEELEAATRTYLKDTIEF